VPIGRAYSALAGFNGGVHHRVKDYAAWRPHFDEHERARVEHSISNSRLYRGVDDANDLMMVFDVAYEARARAFGQSERNRPSHSADMTRSPQVASEPISAGLARAKPNSVKLGVELPTLIATVSRDWASSNQAR
jgi:hypothetical protein